MCRGGDEAGPPPAPPAGSRRCVRELIPRQRGRCLPHPSHPRPPTGPLRSGRGRPAKVTRGSPAWWRPRGAERRRAAAGRSRRWLRPRPPRREAAPRPPPARRAFARWVLPGAGRGGGAARGIPRAERGGGDGARGMRGGRGRQGCERPASASAVRGGQVDGGARDGFYCIQFKTHFHNKTTNPVPVPKPSQAAPAQVCSHGHTQRGAQARVCNFTVVQRGACRAASPPWQLGSEGMNKILINVMQQFPRGCSRSYCTQRFSARISPRARRELCS